MKKTKKSVKKKLTRKSEPEKRKSFSTVSKKTLPKVFVEGKVHMGQGFGLPAAFEIRLLVVSSSLELSSTQTNHRGGFILEVRERDLKLYRNEMAEIQVRIPATKRTGSCIQILAGMVESKDVVIQFKSDEEHRENILMSEEETSHSDPEVGDTPVHVRMLSKLLSPIASKFKSKELLVPDWLYRTIHELTEITLLAEGIVYTTGTGSDRFRQALLPKEDGFLLGICDFLVSGSENRFQGSSPFLLSGTGTLVFRVAASIDIQAKDSKLNLLGRAERFMEPRVRLIEEIHTLISAISRGTVPIITIINLFEKTGTLFHSLQLNFSSSNSSGENTFPKNYPAPAFAGKGRGMEIWQGAWLACLGEIKQRVREQINQFRSNAGTRDIASVEPNVLCSENISTRRIKLKAASPGAFGQYSLRESPEIYFANGGSTLPADQIRIPVTASNWTPDEITITLPDADLHSGYIGFRNKSKALTGGACNEYAGISGDRTYVTPGETDFFIAHNDNYTNYIEIIQDPQILMIKASDTDFNFYYPPAQGGNIGFITEACTPVTIEWKVGFRPGRFQDVDNRSLWKLSIILSEDNRILLQSGIDYAYLNHRYTVTDNSPKVFILTVSAFSDRICGRKSTFIIVGRYNALHLSSDIRTRVQAGQVFNLTIERSCVLDYTTLVELSSEPPGIFDFRRIAMIPDNRKSFVYPLKVLADQCMPVKIFARSPGYQYAVHGLQVISNPMIHSVSPAEIPCCSSDPVKIRIHGTCFSETTNQVKIFRSGEEINLSVISVSPDRRFLECQIGKDVFLRPGNWEVSLFSNGLSATVISGGNNRIHVLSLPDPVINRLHFNPRGQDWFGGSFGPEWSINVKNIRRMEYFYFTDDGGSNFISWPPNGDHKSLIPLHFSTSPSHRRIEGFLSIGLYLYPWNDHPPREILLHPSGRGLYTEYEINEE